jgi:hypothetical protein
MARESMNYECRMMKQKCRPPRFIIHHSYFIIFLRSRNEIWVVGQFDNGTPSIARPVPENGGFHAEQCSALHKLTHCRNPAELDAGLTPLLEKSLRLSAP